MKRLKKWKKVIILLAVIASLVAARILMFESVRVYWYRSYLSITENYEKYYLFEGKVRKRKSGILYSYLKEEEFILMFQWDYNKLMEEMNVELYERLDRFVEQYEFVSKYEVNEQDRMIKIIYDKDAEEKKVRGEDYYGIDYEAEYEIEKFCQLKTSFMKSDDEYNIYLYDISGEYVMKVGRNN